jgi:hypothetical protein
MDYPDNWALYLNWGNTLKIGGNSVWNFASNTPADNMVDLDAGSKLQFLSSWTGSWNQPSWTLSDWENALLSTDASYNPTNAPTFVDSTQINDSNFSEYFAVNNGSLQLASQVPEPTSIFLMMGGLGLLIVRGVIRRKA